MRRVAVLIGAGALVFTACGDDSGDSANGGIAATTDGVSTTIGAAPTTDEAGSEGGCSAADTDTALTAQALPREVETTRQRIVEAAKACDWDRLAELTSAGEDDFSYSFGGGDDPIAAWQRSEAEGDAHTALLVELLSLPMGEEDGVYFWPSAHGPEPTDADWDALAAVYPEVQVREWRDMGAYLGHRVGIAADGEWLFFVGGD